MVRKEVKDFKNKDLEISKQLKKKEMQQAKLYNSELKEEPVKSDHDILNIFLKANLEKYFDNLHSSLQSVIDTYADGKVIENSKLSQIILNFNSMIGELHTYTGSNKVSKNDMQQINEKFEKLVPLFVRVKDIVQKVGKGKKKNPNYIMLNNIENEIKNKNYSSVFNYQKIPIQVSKEEPVAPPPVARKPIGKTRKVVIVGPAAAVATPSPRKLRSKPVVGKVNLNTEDEDELLRELEDIRLKKVKETNKLERAKLKGLAEEARLKEEARLRDLQDIEDAARLHALQGHGRVCNVCKLKRRPIKKHRVAREKLVAPMDTELMGHAYNNDMYN